MCRINRDVLCSYSAVVVYRAVLCRNKSGKVMRRNQQRYRNIVFFRRSERLLYLVNFGILDLKAADKSRLISLALLKTGVPDKIYDSELFCQVKIIQIKLSAVLLHRNRNRQLCFVRRCLICRGYGFKAIIFAHNANPRCIAYFVVRSV